MAENYPALLQDVWDTGRARRLDSLVRNPGLARRVERFALARVDRVMVVIEEAADHIKGLGVPPDRIHVVSNTPPQMRAVRAAGPPTIDIAYLGIIELARGLDLLLDALTQLASTGIRTRTRLIGGGRDLDLIRTRARSQGLGSDTVEFTGFVPDHGVALGLMAEARIGILPHLVNDWARTTIPNKLFDYMAAGMAVLSSDAPPCRRIIEAAGAGRVFRSGDAMDLAKQIGEMLGDADELAACGRAGRAAITARYNWETDSQELLAAVDLTVSPR
jgi:glycosyltransferase involved in cell wall biosynthesis